MARKKSNSNAGGRGARRAPEAVVEPELEAVDTDGAGIEEGIVFTTFALLAGAVFLIYSLLDGRYPGT